MNVNFLKSDISESAFSTRAALILGPSLGTTAHLWDGARADLDARFNVYAWDLPGHGNSPAASESISMAGLAHAVLQLADKQGLKSFHYAGESIGGAVGLELARLAPDRVSSLTVACSAALIGTPGGWRERAEIVREQGLAPVVAATPSRWFTSAFIAENQAFVSDMLADLQRTNPEDYAALCEALSNFDARTWLSEVTVPTLVIAGEADPVVSLEQAATVARGVQKGRLEVIPEASHQVVVERPERVATLIREFVEENS